MLQGHHDSISALVPVWESAPACCWKQPGVPTCAHSAFQLQISSYGIPGRQEEMESFSLSVILGQMWKQVIFWHSLHSREQHLCLPHVLLLHVLSALGTSELTGVLKGFWATDLIYSLFDLDIRRNNFDIILTIVLHMFWWPQAMYFSTKRSCKCTWWFRESINPRLALSGFFSS